MIQLKKATLQRHELRTRMPFRYGIVTMTELPHVFIEVEAKIGGKLVRGISADHLPPKWFTKEPEKDPRDEIIDMLKVIEHAMQLGEGIQAENLFSWWWQLFQKQDAWANQTCYEALLAHFGTSLVERAMIDAFCRYHEKPFHELLHANAFGIDWSLCESKLDGVEWVSLLPDAPIESTILRHTVGMVDPLTEAELSDADRIEDGLPQSLEACIQFYGLSDFKLKLCGDSDKDFDRLKAIAAVVIEQCGDNYQFSLDANEQFAEPEQLKAFGERVYADAELSQFFEHIILIEQPLSRKVALKDGQTDVRNCWPKKVAIIIDESDGGWNDLPRAIELGYSGVSQKNCKGIFKGLRNKCLVEKHRSESPDERIWLTSAEDLANIGPVALLQDLAVQACYGNVSIERNGHHYFAGLSMFPDSLHQQMLSDHADCYEADSKNGCRLLVKNGQIQLGSINSAPFGIASVPTLS